MDPTSLATQTPTADRTPRLSSTRLVLGLMLATPLAFGLAFGGPGFITVFPPVIVGSIVAALVGVAVLFVDRRWMVVAGLTTAVLTFALGAADPTPGAMTRPSLGLQMSWGHAARFAGLVGLVAGIAHLRRPGAGSRLARASPLIAVLALGLAIGVGATTNAALADPGFRQGGVVVAVTPDATVAIVEKDNAFAVEGSVAPGQLVQIVVENRDASVHSFTTAGGPAADADNLASSTTQILARAPDARGEWRFVCKYHPEMRGSIAVA